MRIPKYHRTCCHSEGICQLCKLSQASQDIGICIPNNNTSSTSEIACSRQKEQTCLHAGQTSSTPFKQFCSTFPALCAPRMPSGSENSLMYSV
jgi:hypothetical protein